MTFKYYDIQKNWRKLKPLYEQDSVLFLSYCEMEAHAEARLTDFNKENEADGIAHRYSYEPKTFTKDLRPWDYESCDWMCYYDKPGRKPGYFQWVRHSACHWIVNANYLVITELEPNHPWQIVESDFHSTCVDVSRGLMFDTNFLALGISAEECYQKTCKHKSSKFYDLGEFYTHEPSALLQHQIRKDDVASQLKNVGMKQMSLLTP